MSWAGFWRFLRDIAVGIISAAIFSYLFVPDAQIALGALGFGLVTIPLFLGLGALASALFGIYLIVRIVELIATKLHLFDMFDIDG